MTLSRYLQDVVEQMVCAVSPDGGNLTASHHLNAAIAMNQESSYGNSLIHSGNEDVTWGAVLALDHTSGVSDDAFLDDFFDTGYWDDHDDHLVGSSWSQAEVGEVVDTHFSHHDHFDFGSDPSDFD